MGGYGSGKGMRWNRSRYKRFTSQTPCLDSIHLSEFIKSGITQTVSFLWSTLTFILNEKCLKIISDNCVLSVISLVRTPCHFGGSRDWFLCPLCFRKTSKIYITQESCGCRICLKLAYPSQNETLADRILRKKRSVWKRLQKSQADLSARPKGMHIKTYQYLCQLENHLSSLADAAYFTSSKNYPSVSRALL